MVGQSHAATNVAALSPAGVAPGGATFVAGSAQGIVFAGGSQPGVAWAPGALAASGDLMVIYAINNNSVLDIQVNGSNTLAGVVSSTGDGVYDNILYQKVLTGSDISTATINIGGTAGGGGFGLQILVYHGATSLANRGFVVGSAGSIAQTGFTPSVSPATKGVLQLAINQGAADVASISPGSWTMRNQTVGIGGSPFFRAYAGDLLTGYVGGTNETISGFTGAAYRGYQVELLA